MNALVPKEKTILYPGGSLDKLFRSSRVQNLNDHPPYTNIWSRLTEWELLIIASDIASGMGHLESKQVLCLITYRLSQGYKRSSHKILYSTGKIRSYIIDDRVMMRLIMLTSDFHTDCLVHTLNITNGFKQIRTTLYTGNNAIRRIKT